MKRTIYRGWLSLLLGVVICTGAGVETFSQTPPSRPATVGNLELVASLMGDQPAGLAITDSGRLLVTFPRHDGAVAFTVGEVKQGQIVAYPNAELNKATKERPADTLFSVQGLRLDVPHRLWMLDTGTLQFGEPPVKGAGKLIAVDLNRDFRIDFHRGQSGTVFITDSAPGSEALIVLDLQSGHAMRRLAGIPAVSAQPGRTPIVGLEPLLESPGKSSEQARPKPWLVGLNALELSADGKTLYFSAFTGLRLYSVDADDLSNPAVDDGKLASEVVEVGDVGMGGHFALDASGGLFFLNIEQNAIFRRTADGRTQAVVVDPRLMWPDTLAIGTDKYLYVTTSQHDRRPEFHGGKELRQRPYGLYRVFVGAGPATARLR